MSRAEKFWDNRAGDFERNEKPDAPNPLVERTSKHLAPSDIVLDFGCATGSHAIELSDYAKEIYGVDISSRMIAAAQEKAAARQLNHLHFSKGTIFNQGFEPEMFNLILGFNILHLLDDAPGAVKRIYELLKPDGRFISTTPCLGERKGLLSFVLSLAGKLGLVPHLTTLKFADVEKLATQSGFKLVETEGSDGSPPSFYMVAQKAK